MAKKQVDYHPSVLIAQVDTTGELLMSGYDGGYPTEVYRGAANLIGGNPSEGDRSPLEVLRRELAEELDPKSAQDPKPNVQWASEADIALIRDSLLNGMVGFADFYVLAAHLKGDQRIPYNAIFSAFFSLVSQEVIECARDNISTGKRIVSEGTLGVYTLDELASRGEHGCAHGTPMILEERFRVKIPRPQGFSAERLRTPIRDSFEEYHAEFDYKPTWVRE